MFENQKQLIIKVAFLCMKHNTLLHLYFIFTNCWEYLFENFWYFKFKQRHKMLFAFDFISPFQSFSLSLPQSIYLHLSIYVSLCPSQFMYFSASHDFNQCISLPQYINLSINFSYTIFHPHLYPSHTPFNQPLSIPIPLSISYILSTPFAPPHFNRVKNSVLIYFWIITMQSIQSACWFSIKSIHLSIWLFNCYWLRCYNFL